MRIDILTLFPQMFAGYLGQSILKLAIQRGLLQVALHNIRDWATDRHGTVDDKPYGGGPGMVLKVEPVVESVEAIQEMDDVPGHLVLLTPQGRTLRQAVVEELAEKRRLVLLCGRYEGFDERVREILKPDEISVGDYVLSGGEVPAMLILDSVARLVPGVLGDEESNRIDSFSGPQRLLEFSQYTRPREYRGLGVPPVLLSGDHGKISKWREQQRLDRTREKRLELLSPENSGEPHSLGGHFRYHSTTSSES